MESLFSATFIVTLLAAGVRMAIPLLLPATGEIFAERAGILNINLEGQMLMGAFASFLAGYYTHSLAASLLAGALSGVLAGLLMALCCIRWHCNHVVVGITLNMFALGFTSFWYRVVFGVTTSPPKADVNTGTLPIPGLSAVPALGDILFNQNFLFYVSVLITAAAFLVLKKT